jgi:hypothetical protein
MDVNDNAYFLIRRESPIQPLLPSTVPTFYIHSLQAFLKPKAVLS